MALVVWTVVFGQEFNGVGQSEGNTGALLCSVVGLLEGGCGIGAVHTGVSKDSFTPFVYYDVKLLTLTFDKLC